MLINAAKHARADHVRLYLRREDDLVQAAVEDDLDHRGEHSGVALGDLRAAQALRSFPEHHVSGRDRHWAANPMGISAKMCNK